MKKTDWRPHNYPLERWTPDPKEMLIFHITGVKVSHDPVKPPTLVISMRASGRRDGKQKWSGLIYMNFGRSDGWDDKIGELVLFFLNVAREPVNSQPDWSEVTRGVGLHAFLGRLTANDFKGRRYHNIVSIQRDERLIEPGKINSWTTDGMVFPSDTCWDLVSVEEYDGPPEEFQTSDGLPCDEYGNLLTPMDGTAIDQGGMAGEDDATFDDMEDPPPSKTKSIKKKPTGPSLELDQI